ncbi:MAG: carboxypeptidase-like regulatory domain-containing protein [Nocardioides sp.]
MTRTLGASLRRRRLAAAIATTALALTGLGVVAPAAHADTAPSNDDLANAITLSGALPLHTTGTVAGATLENGESADFGGGSTVWYSWTATTSGPIEVNLAGSRFDTVLAVMTGDDVADLNWIVDNDDFYDLQSAVDFDAVAGQTYRIMVDRYDGETATQPFDLAITAAPTVVRGTVVVPDGIPLSNVQIWVPGSDVQAQVDEDGHYELPVALRADGPRTITYRYYGNDEHSVSHDVTQQIVAGATTVLDVDLTTAEAGVTVTAPAVHWGADFADALTLSGTLPSFALGNDSDGGTHEEGEDALGDLTHTVWYSWTPSTSGLVSVQAAGNGQVTGVFTGQSLADLEPVVADARRTVQFEAVAGTTYRVLVGSWSAAGAGLFQLLVQSVAPTDGVQGTATRNDGGAGMCVHLDNDDLSMDVTADVSGHYSAPVPAGSYDVYAYVCGHGTDATSPSASVTVGSGFVDQDLRINVLAPARLDSGVLHSSHWDFGNGDQLPNAVLTSIRINASAIGYPDFEPEVVMQTVDGVSGFRFAGAYDPSLLLSGTVSGSFLVAGEDDAREFAISTGTIDPRQFVLGADYRVVVDLDAATVSFEQLGEVANPPATTSVDFTVAGATGGSLAAGSIVPLTVTVDTNAEGLRGTLLLTDNGVIIGQPLPIGHVGDPDTSSRTVSWTVPSSPATHALVAIFSPDLDSNTVGSRTALTITVATPGGPPSGGGGGGVPTPTPSTSPSMSPSPSVTPKPTPTPTPSASPTPQTQPTADVAGKPKPGKKLIATIDDLPEGATVSYQWFVGGKKVKHHGQRKGYTVKDGDQGRSVKVRITIEVPGQEPIVRIVRVGRVR